MIAINKLFCILGPSGVGKTTLGRKLKEDLGFVEIVSHTTRKPREGEVDGVTYHFEDNFDDLSMIEEVEYDNNRYGFSKEEVDYKLNNFDKVFCIINKEGIKQFKEIYNNLVVVFLWASIDECYQRLLERDGIDSAKNRMKTCVENDEFNNFDIADYIIKSNDGKIDQMVKIMEAIVDYEE
ncbi:MAG: guanylate kinase [Atribacterota bacterium]